jgi:trehalose-phosphatase
MRHLLWHWRALRQELERARQVLVLLDFDGTLAPIVEHPGDARVLPECAAALHKLSSVRSCTLGFLSGRPLTELRGLLRLPGCFYAGNCGMEWEGPGFGPLRVNLPPTVGDQLRTAREMFGREMSSYPGAFVEDKAFSFAVHYRAAPPRLVPQVEQCLGALLARVPPGLCVRPGKMAVEIRPAGARDKGNAARAIVRQVTRTHAVTPLIILFGDDDCDEPAFEVVSPLGWPVLVGGPKVNSHATCYVEGSHEVAAFLSRIADCLHDREVMRAAPGVFQPVERAAYS